MKNKDLEKLYKQDIRMPKWKIKVQTNALLTKKFFQQYRKYLTKTSIIKYDAYNISKKIELTELKKIKNIIDNGGTFLYCDTDSIINLKENPKYEK